VAEVQALAGDRADLLAEVAGGLEGFSEGELDEPFVRQAARLCRKAGLTSKRSRNGPRRPETARGCVQASAVRRR
jgi:hypothetical protein